MKKINILGISMLIFSCNQQENPNILSDTNKNIPIPTAVFQNMENEKEYEEKRDAYFDLIHSDGTNSDWRAINAANFETIGQQRAAQLKNREVETFADGNLEGEWRERGSNDVPGNIRICDFHANSEDIYAISDGGTLWRGNLDGSNWTPLNDNLQLDRRVIKVVDLEDGTVRVIAAIGTELRYSDDQGLTWTESDAPFGNGSGINLIELNDAENTLVYLYSISSALTGASDNRIAYSTDHGETFTYVADLNSSNSRYASMDMPHNSSFAYILDNNDDLYKFEGTTLTLITEDLNLLGSYSCMIQANNIEGVITLYALMNNNTLYKSENEGTSFELVGNLPTNSWEVGFELSENTADVLYYGEVNMFRSLNGGVTWETVSEWYEYYDDVANKIHADIMQIEPFVKNDGTEFTLIPNHGGISVSYDNLSTTPNIALNDLNTGQFYDVLTHPDNAAYIFGGTQDQGFQRTLNGNSLAPSSFEQVISGDYGQMQFTNNAENIWIQYPGADFQLYTNATTDGYYDYSIDINGSNMPNADWIVPTGAAPHPSDDFIYVGGGNLDGGSGSHLIKLTYTGTGIASSQFDYNFFTESGGSAISAISAIETTPLEDKMIYVVTENGRVFHSEDEGSTFERTESHIGPSGSWIYPADIFASRITPGLVFVAGSGYAGNSVYVSRDSAKTFEALEGDLPNTFTHEIVMDPLEKFLFAATDAGPYVYDMELNEWFSMAGVSAPLQEYISVEFIPSEYIVRYATWGRGIWDFDLTAVAGIEKETKEKLSVYPNPSNNGFISINLTESNELAIFDLNGKKVHSGIYNEGINQINLSDLSNGTYLLITKDPSDIVRTEKIVLVK